MAAHALGVEERTDEDGIRHLTARCTCGWRRIRSEAGLSLLRFVEEARRHEHRDLSSRAATKAVAPSI